MRTFQSEIVIDAPPEAVWDVLTDFAAYPAWSTFIARIEGSPEVGTELTVRLQPPGGRGMTFKPTVQYSEPARHLGWLGRLLVRGVFDGAHEFVLTGVADVDGAARERTHLVQRERFTGVLVPLFARTLERTALGFDQFNEALQVRAEGRAAHP